MSVEQELQLIKHRNSLRLSISKARKLGMDCRYLEEELMCEEFLDEDNHPQLYKKPRTVKPKTAPLEFTLVDESHRED